MKVNPIIREIVFKTRQRDRKVKRISPILALIPPLIFSLYIVLNVHTWTVPDLIILPFGIVGIYLISMMTIIDVIFGYSIFEVLSPRVSDKMNSLNEKIQKIFSTPNRVDELERKVSSVQNLSLNPRIEELLGQIANDFQGLNNKKLPEIITEIYKELTIIKDSIKLNKYPCTKCKNFFEAKGQDDVFTIAMREKCSVCDMLNLTLFRRWIYVCEHCQEPNYIFWHHMENHPIAEVRLAEKMFYESE